MALAGSDAVPSRPISVGVARTRHLAKIASQVAKPDGLVAVDPAGELDFLHDLPVALMWGVGPVTEARLAAIDVRTIGQLARTPGWSLQRVLGPAAGAQGEVEVLIAASRKDKVEDRVAAAEAAGLKATVVDVESFATESALRLVSQRLPGGGADKLIALIDVGASLTTITVLRNGQPVYTREQAFGGTLLTQVIARHYGMSVEEAEVAKRAGTLPEAYRHELLRPFLDSLALETSRALQFFFTSTQYNQVDYLVLAGGCAVMPGLADVVRGRTQVETLVANPFAGMAQSTLVRPKSLLADAPSLMVACGLALRRFDA